MLNTASKNRFLAKLRCPECQQGALMDASTKGLRCGKCGQEFPIIEGLPFLFTAGSLSGYILRDKRHTEYTKIRKGDDHGGIYHWKEYHIKEFLPSPSAAREVLLLGCGDATEAPKLRELGFEAVSFDVRRLPSVDFLADAHRIPLQDKTFDMVLSMQVLEHLHSPWVAAQEIARVLRPGGWFVGSVAFLKPYHGSYYHMTHEGVTHLLESHGLRVDVLMGAQSLTYTLYGNLLPLGTRWISRHVYSAVDQTISFVRAKLWSTLRRTDPNRPSTRYNSTIPLSFSEFEKLRFAPAIVFRAQKSLPD